MATPSSGGDSDKAIPQSLPPPSLMESWARLQQEDNRYDAQLELLWQPELLHGNRYDASDMSGPTDFSGATSFTGATSFNDCATWSGATRHNESYGTTLGYGEVEEVQSGATRHYEIDWATLGFDEVEEVETRREGRGEGEMEEGHLNSAGCLKKGKRKVRSPRGDRGNKKTTGARIEISLDDILQVEQMRRQEAARHLKVSASTLKRVCREHGILRWPPRMGKDCINQSGPSESILTVDQEGIAQQRPDTPRSSNSNSVIIKARYVNDCTIKFRLSRPCVMVELEQQVQKRLKLEAGTYYIKYKDEDNDLIIIACDEDLQDYISSSRPRGTTSIEVLLGCRVPAVPKKGWKLQPPKTMSFWGQFTRGQGRRRKSGKREEEENYSVLLPSQIRISLLPASSFILKFLSLSLSLSLSLFQTHAFPVSPKSNHQTHKNPSVFFFPSVPLLISQLPNFKNGS